MDVEPQEKEKVVKRARGRRCRSGGGGNRATVRVVDVDDDRVAGLTIGAEREETVGACNLIN